MGHPNAVKKKSRQVPQPELSGYSTLNFFGNCACDPVAKSPAISSVDAYICPPSPNKTSAVPADSEDDSSWGTILFVGAVALGIAWKVAAVVIANTRRGRSLIRLTLALPLAPSLMSLTARIPLVGRWTINILTKMIMDGRERQMQAGDLEGMTILARLAERTDRRGAIAREALQRIGRTETDAGLRSIVQMEELVRCNVPSTSEILEELEAIVKDGGPMMQEALLTLASIAEVDTDTGWKARGSLIKLASDVPHLRRYIISDLLTIADGASPRSSDRRFVSLDSSIGVMKTLHAIAEQSDSFADVRQIVAGLMNIAEKGSSVHGRAEEAIETLVRMAAMEDFDPARRARTAIMEMFLEGESKRCISRTVLMKLVSRPDVSGDELVDFLMRHDRAGSSPIAQLNNTRLTGGVFDERILLSLVRVGLWVKARGVQGPYENVLVRVAAQKDTFIGNLAHVLRGFFGIRFNETLAVQTILVGYQLQTMPSLTEIQLTGLGDLVEAATNLRTGASRDQLLEDSVEGLLGGRSRRMTDPSIAIVDALDNAWLYRMSIGERLERVAKLADKVRGIAEYAKSRAERAP